MTRKTVRLSTAPQTRAEGFYRHLGWRETGQYGNGEIRFEMDYEDRNRPTPPQSN